MRTTITKTVSMMLVTVMVLGIFAMPMRASAALVNITPADVWGSIFKATLDIAKQMLNPINNSPNTSAISRFSAFFESSLQDDLLYVTAEQMNELSYWLVQNGISVMPTSVPGRNLIALSVQDTSVFIPAIDTTIELDVNVGDMYTYSGKTIVRIPGGSAAEEDRDSYTGNGSTSNNVGIGDDGQLVDVPTTDKDTGTTVSGGTFIHNETTNNWQVKNENGTYVDINGFHYNPVTQTYHTTTNEWNSTTNNYDQRQYTYQFYYEYTYITYIGSSAEYREAYKVYYELPDGRSSGDLTADELKGISLQFDMVNYDKVASDTVTQFLYPFDGDLDNVAYYPSSGSWVANASTTYIQAPDGFGGALTLNSNIPTRLNLSVPNSDLSEWSLQFRYYMDGSSSSSPFFVMATGLPTWYCSYLNYGDPISGNFYNFYGLVQPVISGMTSVIGNTSWWSYSQYEISAPLLTIYNGNLYAGLNDSVMGVDAVDETGFNAGSLASLLPGQWYDISVFCYGVDDSNFYRTIYPHPSNGASQYNEWVSSNSYYIYVNGILVGTYRLPVLDPGIGGATSRNTYYSSSLNSLSFGWNRFWSNSTGTSTQTKLTNSPIWGFSSISSISFLSTGNGFPVSFLDNLRFLNVALYTGAQSFTPSPVPFDTNLVYVLPSVADLNDNTVAIMSQLPVFGYRVGGVRPTDPTLAAGYVYMHIDGEFVDSVQQYNGSYWEEVTARLYTGIRWIPVTAFNVYTLEDMFDIIDPDADGGGDTVSSIYQYYLWWSGEWGTFQDWLKGTLQTLIEAIQNSGGGGSTDAPVIVIPGVNDSTTTNEITTQNPDGSTTVTTIVSNAAGLVYSRSVTTWPANAEGVTHSREIYTDSSGVMYSTEWDTDAEGNTTITSPEQATGTLSSILKMVTNGVMSIAGTVIEGFVTIVVDGVKFIIESADSLIDGVGSMISSLASSITDFAGTVEDNLDQPGVDPAVDGDGDGGPTYNMFDVFFEVLPPEIVTALTLCFIAMIALPIINKMHF